MAEIDEVEAEVDFGLKVSSFSSSCNYSSGRHGFMLRLHGHTGESDSASTYSGSPVKLDLRPSLRSRRRFELL